MKKKISILLALMVVFTIVPSSSFAQNSYDKHLKDAIIKSKELFNIGSEYDKFNQSISSSDGKTVFYLNWSDSLGELGEINVSMTLEGIVLSYGKWMPIYGEEESRLPSISKEEGFEIAKNFIGNVNPSFAENIKYIDRLEPLNIYSDSYSYNFVRVENGIPYYNNSIDIYVNNSTGEIRNYYVNWDMELEFIDTKDIISLEKAKNLYKEKIGLDLIYKRGYKDGDSDIFLVYGPLNNQLGINAKDEEIAQLYGDYALYERTGDIGGIEDESIKENLSPDEEKAIDDIADLISKEEAEKLARQILEIDETYNLTDINLYTSWPNNDEYNWEMSFVKDYDENALYTSISINAKSKKLLSFYKDESIDKNSKVKFNREQSLKIAKDFIHKVNKENYDEIELREGFVNVNYSEDGKRQNFNFIRKMDNAYVEDDGIYIYVDAVNGQVSQYRLSWTNKDFPRRENLISLDKAYDILYDEIEIELKYAPKKRYDIYNKTINEKKEAILIYGLKSEKPANIDAKTGTILNDNGIAFKTSSIPEYKDIKESYAKEKIEILGQYGIVLDGDNFKPKENIIQKDFLYLLAKAKYPYYGSYNSEDDLYKQLINIGIIKEEEKAPERIVTKEEAVKYIIRALEYDKVADLAKIYKDVFKDSEDINPELKGYIAIAYGLEIIQGYNGNFNPKTGLKREDAANIIYNFLF